MSEWKQGAAKRRDARATKSPDVAGNAKASKRKDTKRWCKGKEGAEHQPICMKKTSLLGFSGMFDDWRVLACSVCGKELDHYSPMKWGTNKPKPDWVTF